MAEVIQGLWIGPRLSVMERLCITSFLRNGHAFHLYVYQATEGVPSGTVVLDANEILPSSQIFTYRDVPSYAAFANFFRYKLLLERGGWFVDADTICVKPFDFADQYVFSSQGTDGAGMVNVAAIKAPMGSAVMQFVWDACQRLDVGTLRWGQSGPELITRAVEHSRAWDLCWGGNMMLPKASGDAVGWLDDSLVGWGYDDSLLAAKLVANGVRTCFDKRIRGWHLRDDPNRGGNCGRGIWDTAQQNLPILQRWLERLDIPGSKGSS